MSDLLDLNGKTALVTGAGQNVGREIALYCAAHGAGVVVNDFVLERAQAVAEDIDTAGGKALAIQGDVTDHAGVKAMVAQASEWFGGVDILVNNAGNAGANPSPDLRKPFWETGPEVWNGFIGVNLHGVINCASAVIPGMIERGRGGRIITIISDAGRMGESGLEIYSAAKAGAAGFSRAIARALGRANITANTVAIAAMNTPQVGARLKADPERFKKVMANYVIRRLGEPSDVAAMVLFLASDASGWITGQTYPVNGGFSFAM